MVYLYIPCNFHIKPTFHTHTHTHIHTWQWLDFPMKTHCVLCETWTVSLYTMQTGFSLQLGHWSLPSKALVRSWNRTCTIYGGQSALRRVFLRVRRASPVSIIPFIAPHSFTHLPLMLHTLITVAPNPQPAGNMLPWYKVILPAETTEVIKHTLSLSLAKSKYKAQGMLKTYELLIYGDLHY
jgi:hypothetical protein